MLMQASGRMYTLLARARNELRLTLPSETVSAIDDLWAAIPKVLASCKSHHLNDLSSQRVHAVSQAAVHAGTCGPRLTASTAVLRSAHHVVDSHC